MKENFGKLLHMYNTGTPGRSDEKLSTESKEYADKRTLVHSGRKNGKSKKISGFPSENIKIERGLWKICAEQGRHSPEISPQDCNRSGEKISSFSQYPGKKGRFRENPIPGCEKRSGDCEKVP